MALQFHCAMRFKSRQCIDINIEETEAFLDIFNNQNSTRHMSHLPHTHTHTNINALHSKSVIHFFCIWSLYYMDNGSCVRYHFRHSAQWIFPKKRERKCNSIFMITVMSVLWKVYVNQLTYHYSILILFLISNISIVWECVVHLVCFFPKLH